MPERTDVFVVGGGPAGLAAAIAARQQGLSVILADGAEPPIDKPCGEGLMPETLIALAELGIQIHEGGGVRFRGIRFIQKGVQVSAEFSRGQGLGIRRPLLHEKLVAKAKECGVQLLWKTAVVGIEDAGVRLSGKRIEARWIIGADGSGSRVRKWSGLEAAARKSQRYTSRRHYRVRPWSDFLEVYWSGYAQAYVTPTAEEEICVVMMGESPADASFDEALRGMPNLGERLAHAELNSHERGAITFRSKLRKVCNENVALVGDASGGVDAITGEGLRLAFRHALTVAEAMASGKLEGYVRAHRRLEKRPSQMGALLLLLGHKDKLRARVVQAMAARRDLFGRLMAIHQGHATVAEMVKTGAMLGWQFLIA